MNARAHRGFTLLELMVVVAIIGILAAMSAAAFDRIGSRNAAQSAASELGSLLQKARSLAEQRGSDVYVLVYPTMTKAGALTGGSGAVFIYEDTNGDFLAASGACAGAAGAECNWASFDPPNNIVPASGSRDRLIDAFYLDKYAKNNVRFGKPTATAFTAPFATVTGTPVSAGCSFCVTGGGSATTKGAVVFTGEQQLRFLNSAGQPVAQRLAGLALQGKDNPNNTFLFGLVGATGLVSLVR